MDKGKEKNTPSSSGGEEKAKSNAFLYRPHASAQKKGQEGEREQGGSPSRENT